MPLRAERTKKEFLMKILKCALAILLAFSTGFAQTEKLGMGSFANEKGPILMAVDASLAIKQLDQPYLMFVLYMAAKKNQQAITVSRDDVVLVYSGQEFHLPTVKEFRQNYNGQLRDLDFYKHLGKEGIISSWTRVYAFSTKDDFFPPNTLGASLAIDEGNMYNFVGFNTLCYFKNPGFKKGDTITIKVKDKKDAALTGEVDVVLQ
jgi:hypothetical protein